MAGTPEGGKKAAERNKSLYGLDFYKRIGSAGGKKGTTGGFATQIPCDCSLIEKQHNKVQCAGKRGGLKSRRGKSVKSTNH